MVSRDRAHLTLSGLARCNADRTMFSGAAAVIPGWAHAQHFGAASRKVRSGTPISSHSSGKSKLDARCDANAFSNRTDDIGMTLSSLESVNITSRQATDQHLKKFLFERPDHLRLCDQVPPRFGKSPGL